jgi:hypothetical protein
MSFKSPPDIVAAGVETGITNAKLSWDRALVAGVLGTASSSRPTA